VREIQDDREIWRDVDKTTQVTLTMPLRLKNAMKAIAANSTTSTRSVPKTRAIRLKSFSSS
jgi:hypothetical protein